MAGAHALPRFPAGQYLPRARKSPSLDGMPDGRQCYRALIFATTTVDADPVALFERRAEEVEREREIAVELGRKLYGDKVTDWKTLADADARRSRTSGSPPPTKSATSRSAPTSAPRPRPARWC